MENKNEWKKVKLGEIVTITMGQSPKSEFYNLVGEGVPFLQGNRTFGKKFPSFDTYTTKVTKIAKKNDVIMSVRAPIGDLNLATTDICLGRGVCSLRMNNGNYEFLFYLLKYYSKQLINNGNGTVFTSINRNEIYNLEINIPNNEFIQKKMSKILSDIDNKIELNNKINNNLEKQVQLIFNNHFFNKDKNYTNYISSNLLEIADFLNGLAMQKYTPNDFNEKSYPVLKIKELNQGFTDKNSDRCSNKIKPEYIINNGDIIFSWSGTLLIKIWCGNKCGLNQHLFKVTSKKYDKWFYFLWINYHLKKFISIAKDKATTMGHIKRADLEKAFVLIPPEKEYESLNKILTPLFENIISNKKENNHLVNLKNYLLPKLMNGEIDIENIEL